ncbi:MAG: hypothetical protein R3180_00530, partial [Marinobacter sp.]|nr:hypothetical protein [Marinobacter sp.]
MALSSPELHAPPRSVLTSFEPMPLDAVERTISLMELSNTIEATMKPAEILSQPLTLPNGSVIPNRFA